MTGFEIGKKTHKNLFASFCNTFDVNNASEMIPSVTTGVTKAKPDIPMAGDDEGGGMMLGLEGVSESLRSR